MTDSRFSEIVANAMTGRSQWVKAGSGRRFRVELGSEEWDAFAMHVWKNIVVAVGRLDDSKGFEFMGMPLVRGTEPGVILRNY